MFRSLTFVFIPSTWWPCGSARPPWPGPLLFYRVLLLLFLLPMLLLLLLLFSLSVSLSPGSIMAGCLRFRCCWLGRTPSLLSGRGNPRSLQRTLPPPPPALDSSPFPCRAFLDLFNLFFFFVKDQSTWFVVRLEIGFLPLNYIELSTHSS